MSWVNRAGGIAGLGAAVYLLLLPGCVCDLWLESSPLEVSPGDASAHLATALRASSEANRASASLTLLAVFLLVVFFARLHGAVRQAAPVDSWLPSLVLAGGVLMGGHLLVDSGLSFAAAELGAQGHSAELARLFVLWQWNSASLFAPSFALALTGTTAVAFTSGLFRPWYRWAGAALLALLILAAAILRAPGLALLPGVLWMFLTSVQLTRRSGAQAAGTTAGLPG